VLLVEAVLRSPFVWVEVDAFDAYMLESQVLVMAGWRGLDVDDVWRRVALGGGAIKRAVAELE
jgi:hypothetical protein